MPGPAIRGSSLLTQARDEPSQQRDATKDCDKDGSHNQVSPCRFFACVGSAIFNHGDI